MADGIAKNDGRYDGQKNNKNIRININKKLKNHMLDLLLIYVILLSIIAIFLFDGP